MSKNKARRLRMFAGPNGSGKSTVFKNIVRLFQIGHYINADDLEKELKTSGFINFYDYGLNISKKEFQKFISKSTIFSKVKESNLEINLTVKNNIVLTQPDKVHSYEASLLASFLRRHLIKTGQSFSFETVMSHPSKIETLEFANQQKFRTYLYYICTDSPLINVERVNTRIKKGGHPVPVDKIKERYFKSLNLLSDAISKVNRAFIFDNSGNKQKLILEISKGKEITIHDNSIPHWVKRYVLEKLI